MRIAFIASECLPFIKTGGLADVGYGLTQSLAKKGHEVIVFMPKYSKIIFDESIEVNHITSFKVQMGYNDFFCGLDETMVGDVKYIFVDNEYFFNRDSNSGYYGHGDDGIRFGFFNRAVLDAFGHLNWYPDIAHTNDWHTGIFSYILNKEHRYDENYNHIKVYLTIHNINFQGWFKKDLLVQIGLQEDNDLMMGDSVNFLKTGILHAHKINTVSPSYRDATLTPRAGEGLQEILKFREHDYSGILNGIDSEFFSPKDNEYIYAEFNKRNFKSKKLENKIKLKEEFGIVSDNSRPLYVLISRLTSQKGVDVLINSLYEILSENLDLIILGDGDYNLVHALEHELPYYDNLGLYVGYNEELAHKLYAAADFFLMPSRFEPCGLAQMICMNFGTIPIVHDIDGLKDSVTAYNEFTFEGNGIKFSNLTKAELVNSIKYAQYLYYNHGHLPKLRKNALNTCFSFDEKVNDYLELYNQ